MTAAEPQLGNELWLLHPRPRASEFPLLHESPSWRERGCESVLGLESSQHQRRKVWPGEEPGYGKVSFGKGWPCSSLFLWLPPLAELLSPSLCHISGFLELSSSLGWFKVILTHFTCGSGLPVALGRACLAGPGKGARPEDTCAPPSSGELAPGVTGGRRAWRPISFVYLTSQWSAALCWVLAPHRLPGDVPGRLPQAQGGSRWGIP